jgi:hypothetical protein
MNLVRRSHSLMVEPSLAGERGASLGGRGIVTVCEKGVICPFDPSQAAGANFLILSSFHACDVSPIIFPTRVSQL